MPSSLAFGDDRGTSKSNWQRKKNKEVETSREAMEGHVSLRYMDEFVGDLQCASLLLSWRLFPDAKEVSESMGVFNAIRKLGLLNLPDPSQGGDQIETFEPRRHGIVVVGDGISPRTAAIFALRTKGWKCYSVDPALRVSTHESPWTAMEKLVVIPEKIENVRIELNRAIIVLVHAHVSMEQAMRAIIANTIVAVLTLPCCNWYGQQELLFGRQPDLVFDDLSILSTHREIRVWIGETRSDTMVTSASALELGKCVDKYYVPPKAFDCDVDAFLDRVIAQDFQLHPETLHNIVHYCTEHFTKDSILLILGNHPHLVDKLSNSGFESIYTKTLRTMQVPLVDVVVDCGHLHYALNKTVKNTAGNLVGELCCQWQKWMRQECHRITQEIFIRDRPTLNWVVDVTTVRYPPNFIYNCHKSLSESNSASVANLEVLSSELEKQFEQSGLSSQPLTPIKALLLCKDSENISTKGIVSRIQTLHWKLLLVDIEDTEGDELHVLGHVETTRNGSRAVKASSFRFRQVVSRDTLVYFK